MQCDCRRLKYVSLKKSLLKRSPNNNKNSVFAVMSFFSFYSFDRERKGVVNKLYKIYILYPKEDFIGNPKRKRKIFVFNFFASYTVHCNVGVQFKFDDKPLHIWKTFLIENSLPTYYITKDCRFHIFFFVFPDASENYWKF